MIHVGQRHILKHSSGKKKENVKHTEPPRGNYCSFQPSLLLSLPSIVWLRLSALALFLDSVFFFCVATSSHFLSHLFPLCVRVTELEVHANGYIGQCTCGENLLPEHARSASVHGGSTASFVRRHRERHGNTEMYFLANAAGVAGTGEEMEQTSNKTFIYPAIQMSLYSCSNKTKQKKKTGNNENPNKKE